MHIRPVFGAALVGAFTATAAMAGVPSAIYTSSGISPLDNIGGLTFNTFDRPVKSADGSRWMLLARNTSGTTTDAMYITGQGTTGTLEIQEGVTPLDAVRVGENMSDRDVAINNSGQWAVITNLTGAVTTDDEVIIRGAAGAGPQSIPVREGQATGSIPGVNYSASNFSPNLNSAGELAYGYTLAGTGVVTANDTAFFRANGANVAVREGAGFAPTGQAGGGTANWASFGNTTFSVADNGVDYMIAGTLANGSAGSDSALAVNNHIVIQEGSPIGSVPGTVTTIQSLKMDAGGDWYSRGKNNNGIGWVVKNGAVVAQGGDAVPGGEVGETWSDSVWTGTFATTFFMLVGNSHGDTVLGGFTSNSDSSRNAAWVYNGSTVILRNGDQVDVDGDTVPDDAFIYFSSLTTASPVPLGGFLTDDGWFYFTAELRNGAGDDLGEAFMRIQVPEPASLALLALGALLVARRRR